MAYVGGYTYDNVSNMEVPFLPIAQIILPSHLSKVAPSPPSSNHTTTIAGFFLVAFLLCRNLEFLS